jgi:glycosyltransferase involved in cell wall biosynthesis
MTFEHEPATPEPPRVSILMPVFNSGPFLHDALASVSAQSFKSFELLVIDDGSTDGSLDILQEHLRREPRMSLRTRSNRGLIETRNELLGWARGELIAWVDSDDISLPERIRLQVAAFDRDRTLVALGGSAQRIDPDGALLQLERYPATHDLIVQQQFEGGGMRFPATMMRGESARAAGGFREPFRMGEDLDLLMRMGELGKLANLDDTIYLYRQHLASVCAGLGSRWHVYRDAVISLARERRTSGTDRLQRGEALSIVDSSGRGLSNFEAYVFLDWARGALDHGNRRLAGRYAWSALVRRPFALSHWKMLARAVLNAR